jgi:hypothetical protein
MGLIYLFTGTLLEHKTAKIPRGINRVRLSQGREADGRGRNPSMDQETAVFLMGLFLRFPGYRARAESMQEGS